MRLNAFRAVKPSRQYPETLFPIAVNGEQFDLPCEHSVADVIVAALDAPANFVSLDRLLSSVSIAEARAELEAFNMHLSDQPAFATCDVRAQVDTRPRQPRGYICKYRFVNQAAATKLLHLASSTRHFDERTAEFLNEYELFFKYSGGFELVSTYWYYGTVEALLVFTAVDGEYVERERALVETRGARTRFSDTLSS